MNFCLGFKNSDHSQAFVSDFSTRIERKSIKGLIINGWYAVSIIAQMIAEKRTVSSPGDIWTMSKLAIVLLWIIGIFSIRLKLEQLKKYHKLIFFLFDLVQCVAALSFFLVFNSGLDKIDGNKLLTIGWTTGLQYIAGVLLIDSWQLKTMHVLFQAAFFATYFGLAAKGSPSTYIYLANIFLEFGFFFYFSEKFTRMEFLEKRKMYEDSEAVKSILDDITEGIVIINRQNKILYLNQPVQKMFKLEKLNTTEELFSRLKIKSMMSSGPSKNSLSPKKEKKFQQGQCLVDVFGRISEELLKEVSIEGENNFILVEAFADGAGSESNIPTELRENHTHSRNYVIKFTTSFYHDNRVIVANIGDTTDRDKILSLQDNSKYKTRLLASVSHELRTPLNASINFTEQALLNPEVPETIKEKYILPALRSNKLLLCLINDILDFSQIEANKLRLVFEPRSVIQTAKECLELLEIQASKKGLELKLESTLKNSKADILHTDHNRLRQVILNLLSNAVKFTFEGRVLLKIEEVKFPLNGYRRGIKVSCVDTGIGISEENQHKLFQAFEKFELGDKIAINSTGVGLGLVISNSIVQRLNGQAVYKGSISQGGSEGNLDQGETRAIHFESQNGKGSTFWFVVAGLEEQTSLKNDQLTNSILSSPSFVDFEESKMCEDINLDVLPSKTDSFGPLFLVSRYNSTYKDSKFTRCSKKSTATPRKKCVCACPKILIVDDDAFNLTALELHLLKLGIPCDSAFNGLIALKKIFERQQNRCCDSCQQYSIVFLDCNMPVMDGIETAKRLREEIQNQVIDDLSIICCTAFVQQSELDQALQAGMNGHCTKPVSFESVKQTIKEFAPNLLNSMK